ncbi:alpha/beta fold hydrolase [Sphingopyxis sp.]|uniref:alpha/beta fold hydrolase n=1 Tax=Sphingopyxis sp. TaxID=1908224 RepID=UPI003D11AF52
MKAFALAACALLTMASGPAIAETATVNGISLHYTVAGTGEPLLLLHGFGSCAADWGSIAEKLSATYKVISIDARGHGQSTNPGGVFSHGQAAEDVRALLDILGIKQARAIGFSTGGITLLHLATAFPDRLSRMVVVSGTNYFPDEARAIMQSAAMESLPPDVLARYRQCASRGEEQVRSLVGQFRSLGFREDDTNIQAADLAKIKARTLIVHGDRDMFFPVSIPVNMYRSISGSALWIVPNGDHSPTAGADETTFVNEVAGFMAN